MTKGRNRQRIAIIGAGGFAREVRWLLAEMDKACAGFEFVGFVVSDLDRLGGRDSQAEVLGDFSWLEEHRGEVDGLALGIGNPAVRIALGKELKKRFPELAWPTLVDPSVRLEVRSCELGEGVLICAGTIGTVNLAIGSFAMINLACTIGHEARIGEGCVLNPAVNISGGVRLGKGVFVGTGAQILQYVQVGDGATVGAGAVVTRDVAAGLTVVGIPARPL